jgi:hypothetical protein
MKTTYGQFGGELKLINEQKSKEQGEDVSEGESLGVQVGMGSWTG